MTFPSVPRALLFTALAASLAPACRRPEARVVYDLAHRASVAEVGAGFELVRFGTPEAELIQGKGFERIAGHGRGDVAAAARARSTVTLIFSKPESRTAVLDAAPQPGHAGILMEVAVNGNVVARGKLAEGRHRYRFDLPADAQRPGRNRIRIRFPEEEARRADPTMGPRLALLYSLFIGAAADPALAASPAPPPLGSVGEGDHRLLVQAGPPSVLYALLIPEAAELRFRPGLHPAVPPGSSATLRVTLEPDGEAERQLWSSRMVAGSPAEEIRLDLPGAPGTPARLTFHVEGPSEPRAGWVVWGDPRVLGRGTGDPLERLPVSPAAHRKADAVRESLAGMNVMIVVLDAAQVFHHGCYGYALPTTPEIDRLAAEGVVFDRHYTPAIFTYASTGSLFTSQYPDDNQREGWLEGGRLPADRLTLAELLSARGIHTAGFVANPNAGTGFGLDRGFSEYLSLFKPPWVEKAGALPKAAVFRRYLHPWLGRLPATRFFVYAHFREPHMPLDQPPLTGPDTPLPPDAKDYHWYGPVNSGARALTPEEHDHLVRLYDGNLAYADRELGHIRHLMERTGLLDRTVLIVTADHGEALGEHGYIGHNSQVYEESMRIPLVIRFPTGRGPTGIRVTGLTSTLDIAPTVADIFGLLGQGGSQQAFHGRSLLPAIVGGDGGAGILARTMGTTFGLVTERYKFIYDAAKGEQWLYDLKTDPDEGNDVAQKQSLRAACYRQALQLRLLDARAFASGAVPEPASLDVHDREALKALGYLN